MNNTLIDLIDHQALIQPNQCAIEDEFGQVTYREILQLSTQFAHFLCKKGIKESSILAISLPASKCFFLAILGILRLGACYVPIDLHYPKERTRQILKSCKPNFFLTLSEKREWEQDVDCDILFLDDLENLIKHEKSTKLPRRPLESDLAYIIYTSGSTGIPKGVMIEYHSLCHLAHAIKEVIPLNSKQKLLQFASIGFDASIFEWVTALTQGATLCCLSDKTNKYDIKKIMCDYKITIVTLPPTLANLLDPKDFPFLQTLIVAGEVCQEKLVSKWKDNVRLFNFYGPTEATIWSTFSFHSILENRPATIIGKPILGVSTYVINNQDELCTQGEIGELLLEGVTLARGYLNDPSLTSQQFVHLQHIANNRLYRTGDFVRVLPDGNIDFIGRKDSQIKIHGHRLELGEIENTINQHSLIDQANVQAYPSKTRYQIICFFTMKDRKGRKSDINGIIEYLKTRLPAFMIPDQFIPLDSFPLNAHLKIDKDKLRECFHTYKELPSSRKKYFQYPSNEMELIILKIWLKVLNKQIIEKENDFFEEGGDSLLAIQLCLELETALSRSIDFSMPYKARTIADQCKFLSPKADRISHIPITLLSEKRRRKRLKLFLIHPASGVCIRYFHLAKDLKRLTVFGINSPFLGNIEKSFSNIESMAAQYIRFIKKIQKKGPYLIGGWSFGGSVAIEIAKQLLAEQPNQVRMVILFDSFNNLSLLPRRNIKDLISSSNTLLTLEELEILSYEFEHNEKIGKAYCPPMNLDCPILLLKSQEKEEAFSLLQDLHDNGWSHLTKREFLIEQIPSQHTNMFEPKFSSIVAEKIEKYI